jgi:hypothetical protein
MQQLRQAAFKPIFQSFRDIVGEQIYLIALAWISMATDSANGAFAN